MLPAKSRLEVGFCKSYDTMEQLAINAACLSKCFRFVVTGIGNRSTDHGRLLRDSSFNVEKDRGKGKAIERLVVDQSQHSQWTIQKFK